ncbi:unnamed protein product [Somion occarium]|uniref:Vacuolar import and degradation protein 21 n=2 Tax=Somion occarium TaxID=3059160 RepID=A0ABP1DAZ8_9APHY
MEGVLPQRASLVAERIGQLNEIRRRRDKFLSEMYILSRRQGLEGEVLDTNINRDELKSFLQAQDMRKQPGMENVAPLLEAVSEPGSPFRYPSVSGTGSPSPGPSRTLSPSAQPTVERPSPFAQHAQIQGLRVSEPVAERMDIDEELIPIIEEPPLAAAERAVSEDVIHVGGPPERPSEQPQELFPGPRMYQPSREEMYKAHPVAARISPGSMTELRREDLVAAAHPATIVSDLVAMQGVEEEKPYGAIAIERPMQREMSEDDVSALLQSSSFSEPPLPITRTESMQARYLLSEPPSSTLFARPAFAFDENMIGTVPSVEEQPEATNVGSTVEALNAQYTLPPFSMLPAEFQRKNKPSRQRKRDREKEKGDGKAQPEWTPLGLNRWGATIRANPVSTKVARANKCLMTKDWNVAITEVRIIRTLDRVEKLKDAGRWSFRQPKKQRGVGGLMKTHRDYLLEEMKWMRTDFREERRWKLALAYNLAHAVMEWHEAGSLEERVRRHICVLWKRPRPDELEEEDSIEKPLDIFENVIGDEDGADDSKGHSTPANDFGSDDDSDDEQDKDHQDVLDPTTTLEDALNQDEAVSELGQIAEIPSLQDVQPKVEDVEDLTALRDEMDISNAMDVDPADPQEEIKKEPAEAQKAIAPQIDNPAGAPGLKPTSQNPLLTSHARHTHTSKAPHSKSKSKPSVYAPLREEIVYSDVDKLFVDLDDFELVKSMSELSTEDLSLSASLPPPDLSSIFPDLQPYGLLDVAPATGSEGKRKSDRRGDKDDPNKRTEDTTYSKLVPTNDFMLSKPTLLGPLEPSRHWSDGQWHNLDETAVVADFSSPSSRPVDESAHSTLFEVSPGIPGASVPIGKKRMPADFIAIAEAARGGSAAKRRHLEHTWTPQDDTVLKQLVERYPGNWVLIADAFNTARVTISTEKRSWMECRDRYVARFMTAGGADEESRTNVQVSQIATRGTKRASTAMSTPVTGGGVLDYKRRRHTLMHETIRKAAKKREQTLKVQASQRKPPAMHDTHGQYNKMPRYTPQELSRMKAERDAREAHEAMMRKRQQEIAAQHQLMQQRAQVGQGVPTIPNRAANGLAAQQAVPQIRGVNISQQQRLSGNANRLSPASALQAQTQAQRLAVAQAQAQGQVPVQVPTNSLAASGAPALSSAHLAASYNARPASSSPGLPQHSPPHLPNTIPHVASPRPPSAQAHSGLSDAQQAAMNALPRATVPHYYPNLGQFTPEQLEQYQQTRRLQSIILQQQAAMQHQNPQNGPYPQS